MAPASQPATKSPEAPAPPYHWDDKAPSGAPTRPTRKGTQRDRWEGDRVDAKQKWMLGGSNEIAEKEIVSDESAVAVERVPAAVHAV